MYSVTTSAGLKPNCREIFRLFTRDSCTPEMLVALYGVKYHTGELIQNVI